MKGVAASQQRLRRVSVIEIAIVEIVALPQVGAATSSPPAALDLR